MNIGVVVCVWMVGLGGRLKQSLFVRTRAVKHLHEDTWPTVLFQFDLSMGLDNLHIACIIYTHPYLLLKL